MTQPEPAPPRGGTLRRFHLMLRSNWISSTGAALATLALLATATGWVLQSIGYWGGPYVGIVTLIGLPALLVAGLLLIPLGLLVYRKQFHERVELLSNRPMHLARAVVLLTLVNFVGVGTVGYAGVAEMSSVRFCGTACHSAMEPEYVAYLNSPHARVECVECHVGPGADWFIKSKINGASQMIRYLTDSYQKPIPTPLEHLRPASETCENCHWPELYLGTKLLVRPHFRDNEAVSAYVNVLLMRRGGTAPNGESTGIHWHAHPDAVVEYVATDDRRETIPWVSVRKPDGTERIFTAEGVDPDNPPAGERRRMDCNDCHNRAAHGFDLPEDAVDRAIAAGLISRRLPFIRKNAVEVLRREHSRETAEESIRSALQDAYNGEGMLDAETRPLLEPAVGKLTEIWRRNVYPHRELTWNSYPDLKGHAGCMRCHEGKHQTRDGRELTSKCDACHVVLSNEEEDPAILEALGLRGQ